MKLRLYQPDDLKEILALFHETVHAVNIADYTKEQCDAWAPEKPDEIRWNKILSAHLTLVAIEGNQIVGFADMDETGYLDHLYVHSRFQRKGVANALCEALEQAVPSKRYFVHASITARPFFEAQGYHVICEQQVKRCSITLINYQMEKRAP